MLALREFARLLCVAAFALAAVSIVACSGKGGALPGVVPSDTLRPANLCPTCPRPTPTPYNGPVGSANNLTSGAYPFVVRYGTIHVVYVSTTASIPAGLGGQIGFLNDLVRSSYFSYILNQYVSNRESFTVDPTPHIITLQPQTGTTLYRDGFSESVTYFDQAQVMSALSNIATQTDTYNIWQVVVPPTPNLCAGRSPTLDCWGPESVNYQQCGFHNYFHNTHGTVYFSLQQVLGACSTTDEQNTADSTLSHELFEIITDPDTQNGWHSNTLDQNGQRMEIGDLCRSVSHTIALPFVTLLGGFTVYDIQPEWSNTDAHCYPITNYAFPFLKI